MAYDMDTLEGIDLKPAPKPDQKVSGKDLEVIVTYIEIAAILLTDHPNDTFTREALIKEMRNLAGDDVELDDRDINIVIDNASFLVKSGGRLRWK